MISSENILNSHTTGLVDFDIHGLIGLRLINPSSRDTAAVLKQLGPLQVNSLNRDPDILIRFEQTIDLSKLTLLGLNDAGFTKDGFYILKSKKKNAKAKIPFETIGEKCEIICETGLNAVPLLIPIINLTLLRKDCIALHAAAFIYDNEGILVTGWSKGGKTEALLAFTDRGARYVGDEWVILTKDGKRMFGLPEPICVWDWHIEQLPHIQKHLRLTSSVFFKAVHTLQRLHGRLLNGRLKNSLPCKIISEAMPALKRQLHINLPPHSVFDTHSVELAANFNKLFFITSHQDPSISVEPWDSQDIAARMLYSLQYEQIPFFEYYFAFKFAFPRLKNDFLETVRETQSRLLFSALNKSEAYKVSHPYPVSLQALFQEMKPFCTDTGKQTSVKDTILLNSSA